MNHKYHYSAICFVLLLSFSFCNLAFADDSFISGFQLEAPIPITPDSCLAMDEESGPQPRGLNSITEVQITPEIQALARALDNNPVKIYEYVRNNIDYVPLLGVRNGATVTLLSKRGNDADQCALLIALLKAADPAIDAVYARGYVVYPVSFMANLLNVDANTNRVLSRLWGGLIPADVDPNDASWIQVYRYWVETTISNTTYTLDPAYKEYVSTNALDILSIAGYSRTQFLARATSGATVTANSIRNANEANVRADLTAYSSGLVANIRAQHPNDDISAILGVRKIKRHSINSLPTSTYLTNSVGMYTPTNAAILPDYHYWNLTIQMPGLAGITTNLYEIAGKRISIFFTGTNNAPQLWVDGSVKATGSPTTNGQACSMTVTLSRTSFSVTNGVTNNSHVFRLTSGHSYNLAHDFGSASPSAIANTSTRLARDRESGLPETSESILGGAMHLMGLSYFNQIIQQKRLIGQLMGITFLEPYVIGLVAQEEGYFIDIPMTRLTLEHRSGNTAKAMAFFRSTAMLHSALEHGMLEQMQGTNKPAVSTVKLLGLNNATNQITYFATSSNWPGASGVRTQLVNYTDQEISQLNTAISSGMTAVLPKNAAISLAQWTGVGYVVHGPTLTSMTIRGGYNGGFGAFEAELTSILAEFSAADAYVQLPPVNVIRPESLEPVDLASGDYLFENVDLEMGDVEPRGIRFVRQYNSAQGARDSRLRHGWMHNYDIRAFIHSSPDLVLGGRQATDAVSIAIASLITSDLLEYDLSARGWITASLATKWAMDQMIDNAVNIQMGKKSLVYVKLPDGTYNPPPGVTATLTKSNGVFFLKERLGMQYLFNTNNLISAWRDADSNTLSFTYNAQTNLFTVTNGYGRGLTFTYAGATQLTAVVDSSGRSVSYGYSAGNLTSYTDAESKVWTYAYDSNHWMRALANPLLEVTATNTYDALGMVVTQRNAASNSWSFFVVPGWRSVEQDPYGGRTTYTFDEQGRQLSAEDALGNRRRTAYDGQGHVTNGIDPRGFQTRYQYDANHNLTNVVDALTHSTAYVYDSQHRLRSVRDALEHVTQYFFDDENHITNVVDAATNSTATTYYSDGLPHVVTGPRKEETRFTYDNYGNPVTITRTDGGTETRTWNACGDLLALTDANTNTTTFTYDNRRLLTSLRDPYQQRITNLYNAAGLLVTNIDKRNGTNITTYTPTHKVASIRYPDGGTVSNFYDASDRLFRVRNSMSGVTSNGYDLAGRLLWTGDPLGNVVSNRYDSNGNVVVHYDAARIPITNRYDELNRLLCTTDVLGKSVSNRYNEVGWRTATWDQEHKVTEFEHDALGRVKVERHGTLEHTFEYDESGNWVTYVNPREKKMVFGYDAMNRRVEETNALLKSTSYRYDPVGNLKMKVNANGQTNFFGYNALNQLTNRVSGSESVSFGYDPNGNLTNMVDSLGTTRQTFDPMNRLVQVVDAFGQTVSNQYNLAGRRTQIVYPGAKVQAFAYDGTSRLTNVQASAFGLSATTYGYDSRNNLTRSSLPGGLVASNNYDVLSRRLAWSVSKSGSNLLARSCTRNPLGFRTNETISAGLDAVAGAASQTRTHDAADRIVGLTQSGPGATNFPSFDAAGNVTQLVAMAKGQTFTTRYGYDFNNRLTGVTRLRNAPDGSTVTAAVTQLEYDGQGLLLRITENGNVRRLVRDRADPLARPILEMGATTNAIRWFVWANGKLLAQVASNGTLRVAHSDELGKILALTDNNGTLTDEYAYQPYGRLIAHSGTNDLPFAFMGDYGVWNVGHGLYLTRHRAYDANLMRFLQPDPIGLEGGRNLYVYARANPLWFIDPLGLWGVQFGENGSNIGVGFPTMLFTADAWWAANMGAAAGLDGMIPFIDPFVEVYADRNGNIPMDYQISQFLGSFGRTMALGAANAMIAEQILATSGQSLETISSLDRFLFNQVWLGQVVSETVPAWVSTTYSIAGAGLNLGSAFDTWQEIQGLTSSDSGCGN